MLDLPLAIETRKNILYKDRLISWISRGDLIISKKILFLIFNIIVINLNRRSDITKQKVKNNTLSPNFYHRRF